MSATRPVEAAAVRALEPESVPAQPAVAVAEAPEVQVLEAQVPALGAQELAAPPEVRQAPEALPVRELGARGPEVQPGVPELAARLRPSAGKRVPPRLVALPATRGCI